MTKRQSELFPELPSDKKYVSDYPELVAEWHPAKNGDKHSDDYLHGSNKKVWWICDKGHEWQRNGYSMNILKSEEKCPHCRSESSVLK